MKKANREDIEYISAYLDVFEKNEEWFDNVEELKDILYKFEEDLYKNNFIQDFDYVNWGEIEKIERYITNEKYIKKADLPTLQRLLTYHVRVNKFYKGYLLDLVICGHMNWILKRLKEIAYIDS